MKKLKKLWIGVFALCLTLGVSGCGSDSFDASKYVKGILDSTYLGDMSAYMDTVDVSKEEAQKSYEEGIEAETDLLLDLYTVENASDAAHKKVSDAYKEIYKKAKYEVKDATKDGDKYTVEVVIYPMNIYQISYEEMDKEFDAILESDIEDDEFDDAMTEKIAEILVKNTPNIDYGDAQTFKVELKEDGDGLWGMDDDTFYDLDAAIIDYN